jgi:hypothetical protein
MFDNWGFSAGFELFRRLFKHPMTIFIYSILSQWYMIIVVGGVVVTYWVFKGLKDVGVIDKAQTILVQAVEETKGIAQNCTPRILNINDFWNCLSDPANSKYSPTAEDKALQSKLQDGLNRVPDIPGAAAQPASGQTPQGGQSR